MKYATEAERERAKARAQAKAAALGLTDEQYADLLCGIIGTALREKLAALEAAAELAAADAHDQAAA